MAKGKKMNMCEDCDHKHSGDCEDCKICGQNKYCECGNCVGYRRGGCWRWVFRVIFWILILTFVFSAGMLAGAVKVLRYENSPTGGPFGMMNLGGMLDYGWNQLRSVSSDGGIGVFGTVTKVSGNEITLTDNGNKEKSVLSTSATTIISAGEVSTLGEIKEGQTIYTYGSLNDKNQIEATWISVR